MRIEYAYIELVILGMLLRSEPSAFALRMNVAELAT